MKYLLLKSLITKIINFQIYILFTFGNSVAFIYGNNEKY